MSRPITASQLTRLTFDAGPDRQPVWTPDSRRIVFGAARGNNSTTEAPGRSGVNLYWQNADGTGAFQYSFNKAVLNDGHAIVFRPST